MTQSPSPAVSGARAILAVSINTFREAIRNKVFGSLMFFAALMILSSLILAQMSLHHEVRLATNVTIFASTIFAMVISVYSSVTLFHTELERRTIYTILSKPIRRWQFLLGKYFGVLALVLLVLVVMGVITAIALAAQGGGFSWIFFQGFVTLFLQMVIVTALAHGFATFSSPLLAGFATVAIFIGGNLFSQLALVKQLLLEQQSPTLAAIVSVLEIILPNLESLNLSEEITYNLAIPSSYMMSATWYTVSYAAIILVLGMGIFSKRDLN